MVTSVAGSAKVEYVDAGSVTHGTMHFVSY
jgi:hypothetical protein